MNESSFAAIIRQKWVRWHKLSYWKSNGLHVCSIKMLGNTGLSTSLFLTEQRCSANLSDRRRPDSQMQSLQHLLYEMQYMMLEEVHVKLFRITKLVLGPGNNCRRVTIRVRVTTGTNVFVGLPTVWTNTCLHAPACIIF